MNVQTPVLANIRERLSAMISVTLEDSRFDPVLKKIVLTMANNFVKGASEADIRSAVIKLRDDVIPFLLEDETNGT